VSNKPKKNKTGIKNVESHVSNHEQKPLALKTSIPHLETSYGMQLMANVVEKT